MRRFSAFAIAREAIRGHKGWNRQWENPEPRSSYDIIIIGAGGHGLATAYYLASEHGITNIAVLEKGWLGGDPILFKRAYPTVGGEVFNSDRSPYIPLERGGL